MQTQVEILKLEQSLQEARRRLGIMRKMAYQEEWKVCLGGKRYSWNQTWHYIYDQFITPVTSTFDIGDLNFKVIFFEIGTKT